MNRLLIAVIMVVLFAYGCKRVEHEDVLQLQPCDCCLYNDSIEGTYTGSFKTYESTMYPYFNQPISDDQKSVTVSRTFDGLNVLEDSLVCQFEVSDFYETPIRFDYENIKKGEFSPSTYRVQYFDIDDKLVVEKHGSYNYGQKWGGVVYYKIWTFHGSKE